jgi:hypothetical protein
MLANQNRCRRIECQIRNARECWLLYVVYRTLEDIFAGGPMVNPIDLREISQGSNNPAEQYDDLFNP